MKKKQWGRWILLSSLVFLPGITVAQEVNVPENYASIQAAVNALAANPSLGTTIVVEPGTYKENIIISKSVIVRGQEAARVILQPLIDSLPLIEIKNVTGVTVRNLTFTQGDLGVELENVSDVNIVNNVFNLHDQATAVLADARSDASVEHNVFYGNSIGVARNNEMVAVRNNIFSKNAWAISGEGVAVAFNCFFDNDAIGVPGESVISGSDPRFVSVTRLDFHLQQNSPCIDEGDGTDAIDDSQADMGAYGGALADAVPYPVKNIVATSPSAATIDINWDRNTNYLITHTSAPGGYRVYYDSDKSGVPYAGTDADEGASPIDVGDVETFQLTNLAVDSAVPVAPEITNLYPANGQVTLVWSAVSGATSYTVHYGVTSIDDETKVLGNSLGHTITGLVNGATYQFAVSAQAQAKYYLAVRAYDSTADKNTSDYSTEVVVDMGAERSSGPSSIKTAIPEQVVPIPDLPDEGCFIATAAFGYYSAPQVQWLREFRDVHLKRYALGQAFISLYYRFSPPVAEFIRQSASLKQLVRLLLAPLIMVSELLLAWPFVFLLLCSVLGVSYFRWQRYRLKLSEVLK